MVYMYLWHKMIIRNKYSYLKIIMYSYHHKKNNLFLLNHLYMVNTKVKNIKVNNYLTY